MARRYRSCWIYHSRPREHVGRRKARRLLAALLRIRWAVKRQSGSHMTLWREGWPDYVFAFHDAEEVGPRMMARVARHTGLRPEDL
ncbi:MAG: type II toxin-antitoxin system HicA family toxin [Gemmatimonadaceae bacterium]|nr:type II toxin-antitoxin system HicA family toxin [Gemmatimonadaceae bacterium]